MPWKDQRQSENKALDFIQRKKHTYLGANCVLGAFICIRYFKKSSAVFLDAETQERIWAGKELTEQYKVCP